MNKSANKRLAKIVAGYKSRREFAAKFGLTHSRLHEIENGAKITYPMAKRLEKATGISWDRWVQE